MREPFQRTSPWVGASSPHRIRSRLVLPLPFCPAMRSSSPAPSLNDRPAKSFRPPRSHSSSVASSTGGIVAETRAGIAPATRRRMLFRLVAGRALALLQALREPDEDAARERGEVL